MILSFLSSTAAGEEMGQARKTLLLHYENGRVTAELRQVKLADVLQVLAEKTGIAVSAEDDLQDVVTLSVSKVSVEAFLGRLCENRALVYERDPETGAYGLVRAGAYAGLEEEIQAAVLLGGGKPGDTGPAGAAAKETIGLLSGRDSQRSEEVDARGRPLYKAGEILVQFKKSATVEQVSALHKRFGSRFLDRIAARRLEKIKVAEGLSEVDAVKQYLSSDLVEAAERHALRYPLEVPNDPLFSQQWGLSKISATAGWAFTTGDSGVIVAVIDSGVDLLHPDLSQNIWTNPAEIPGDGIDNDDNGYADDLNGWDFGGAATDVISDADADPTDSAASGHGTHVAGIIAARGDNAEGIAGTAWQLNLMALKVKADDSETYESFHIIDALDYARENGAKIVNCSFGSERSSPQERNALLDLESAGILAVCAAGNKGVDIDAPENNEFYVYPAKYDLANILTVAAGTQTDAMAVFSNYGPASVDVLAPGVSIKSTVPVGSVTEASVVAAAATVPALGMQYAGTTGAEGVSGTLYDCGKGYPDEIPEPFSAGDIALIERGNRDGTDFYFSEKVVNAQGAGAIAVIIYNNTVDALDQNGGTLMAPDAWIPAVFVTQTDGALLKSAVGQVATVVNQVPASAYADRQGTSMAAPFVSGLAGLIWSKDPALTYGEVKSTIMQTVDKVPALGGKLVSGGRINAQGALCSVNPVAGDLNCDGAAGLADAVMAARIASGMLPYACRYCLENGTDPVGDSVISPPDVIYLLQDIAGLR